MSNHIKFKTIEPVYFDCGCFGFILFQAWIFVEDFEKQVNWIWKAWTDKNDKISWTSLNFYLFGFKKLLSEFVRLR